MGWLDTAIDFGDDVVSSVGSFFSSGGGEAAANAGEAMAQSQLGNSGGGDFFSTAGDFIGSGFNWLSDPDNAAAANALGGIASGVGQYYNAEQGREQSRREAQKSREFQALEAQRSREFQALEARRRREQSMQESEKDRQMRRDLATQKLKSEQIVPGEIGDYGSYRDNVTDGLISNGMLAKKQESK